MKVKIRKIEVEEVDLSDEQVRDIALEYFKRLFPYDGIQMHKLEDWVYKWEDTGHGSGLTDYIRVASEKDKFLSKVIGFIIDRKRAL